MLLENNASKVESSGTHGGSEFRIKATAKAFRILSDNLYSNKILAFVRELCTNADDSQKQAKTERPFDISLPNELEPIFKVRDYGVGLSDLEVKEIYTTYFESTKDTSNDYTGALGLGSKSPFAYSETFNVTAWKNGIKNVYTIFINQEGTPEHQLMFTGESDEPTGVLVEVPIKAGDWNIVRETTKMVLQWFDTPANIVNYDYTIQSYKDIHPVDECGIYYKWGVVLAKQGPVVYPVKMQELRAALTSYIDNHSGDDQLAERDEAYKKIDYLDILASRGAIIDFNMGDLDIMPSREELSYSPNTVRTLTDKLFSVINTILDVRVAKVVDDANLLTGFAREMHIYNLYIKSNRTSLDKKVFELAAKQGVTSRYISISGYNTSEAFCEFEDPLVAYIASAGGSGCNVNARTRIKNIPCRNTQHISNPRSEVKLMPHIFDDVYDPRKVNKILRRYMKANNESYVLIVLKPDDTNMANHLSDNFFGNGRELLKMSELDKELPLIQVERTYVENARKFPRLGVAAVTGCGVHSFWDEYDEVSSLTEVRYVPLLVDDEVRTGAGKFRLNRARCAEGDLVKIMGGVIEATGGDRVYFLRASHIADLTKKGVTLRNALAEFEDKLEDYSVALTAELTVEKFKGTYTVPVHLKDTLFGKVYLARTELKSNLSKALKVYSSLLPKCEQAVDKLYSEFTNRYPMLEEVFNAGGSYSYTSSKNAIKYVELIESTHNAQVAGE